MGPQPSAEQDLRPLPDTQAAVTPALQQVLLPMVHGYLWTQALCCAAAALMFVTLVSAPPWAPTIAMLFAGLAIASALATRLPGGGWQEAALTTLQMAVMVGLAASAIVSGWGLAAPGLPVAGLLVCVLCATAGWRAGVVLALFALGCVGVVAWAVPPAAAATAAPGWEFQLGTSAVAIAAGLAAGMGISTVLARALRSAQVREKRFRRLLALAADGYWEIDREYRLVAAATQNGEILTLTPEHGLGAVPWDSVHFVCDPDTLDALQADLETRLPFRDVPLRWSGADGAMRDYLASGEPRFDTRGIFTGYWGVARDITAVQAAQAALIATETRYRELFSRIPTPLVLHRNGQVLDANPAALALFGQDELQAMIGSDLLAHYESGDSRERARRRMEVLNGQPLGTALPVTDFKLSIGERRVAVRATSTRMDAEGGPATLAIFVDDTDRLAAEEAVRRSEAMLSHLVATSPDLITLTETASGRYAMVNRSFERLTGWSAGEAVGRTADELGVWASDEVRERFAQTLREQGSVSNLPLPFVSKDGASFSMIVSAARFVMDRRDYLVINARDVTEKERERLEREAILANASIGIAVTRDRHFVLANRHFEQMYGWGPGELLGQPGAVVWSDVLDYAEVGEQFGPALGRGQPVELERAARRRDGSTFTAHIRARAIDPTRPAQGGTVWIIEDVTERRQSEQALARARDAAEAASRAKSAFLANTSHELRTPLNGLIGLIAMARDDTISAERRDQFLEQVAQSAQTLAGVINDILDLSKIEAGKLLIETTAFDLAAELQLLQRTYAPLALARQLELRFELAPGLGAAVHGDPLRVRQIASNFLSNALKFTARGEVCLRARRLPGEREHSVRLEVRDSGPGVAAATLARLFKPFTQADESTTRRFGGTGLGLSICHELAGLMGGTVGAESRVGEGSTFWAELPLPVAPALLPPARPGRAVASGLAGARVLLVEDNPVNMMIAVAMLVRWGVDVEQAQDGSEAVAAVRRAAAEGRRFDAVLMDVQMPNVSGHEATRELRALEAAGLLPSSTGQAALPIIALTAAALVTEREEALRAGMNDFLTKPIDAERLLATLQRWCLAPA